MKFSNFKIKGYTSVPFNMLIAEVDVVTGVFFKKTETKQIYMQTFSLDAKKVREIPYTGVFRWRDSGEYCPEIISSMYIEYMALNTLTEIENV